jgi:hypothetical protein
MNTTHNKTSDFCKGDSVSYIPLHAEGDATHPDVETGVVSSTNHVNVFVKFDKYIKRVGWENTASQAVDPTDLRHN